MSGQLNDMYKTLDNVLHGGLGSSTEDDRRRREEEDDRRREEDARRQEAEAEK